MKNRSRQPLLALSEREGTLYLIIYKRIRELILDGSYPLGSRLPSSRTLATDLKVSRNTALVAIDQLIADGWAEARHRAGIFVTVKLPAGAAAAASRPMSHPAGVRDVLPVPFEFGQSAIDLFPVEQWGKLQSQIWNKIDPQSLCESRGPGEVGLRIVIARHVAAARGIECEPDDIIIISSGQSGLDIAAAALASPGDGIIVENPGYPGARATFALRGLRPVPVEVDADGMNIAKLPMANKPRLAHVTPAVQVPSNVAMSDERRSALLDWADREDSWIIEDDWRADARFDGQLPDSPLRAGNRPERIVFISTFNHILFPSLRLAYMIVPKSVRSAFIAARDAIDGFTNVPNQLVLREFIDRGHLAAHVRVQRAAYGERRQALLNALSPLFKNIFEPEVNGAGLHLVLRPKRHDSDTLVAALRHNGLAASSLAEFSTGGANCQGVLLGFAAFTPEMITAAGERLRAALASFEGLTSLDLNGATPVQQKRGT